MPPQDPEGKQRNRGVIGICVTGYHNKNRPEKGAFSDRFFIPISGFDHGLGHPLLLLYDAKAPLGKNGNYFNGLGHDRSNPSIRFFYIIVKYPIFITI
jgi:hypothetical protein